MGRTARCGGAAGGGASGWLTGAVSGNRIRNVAPLSRPSLWASIVPPCISTSALLIANPNPRPPNRRVMERSACSKASKTRGSASGSIPIPLSFTSMTTCVPSGRQRMPTHPPCGVNLTAFLRRFQKTCWSRGTSASTQ